MLKYISSSVVLVYLASKSFERFDTVGWMTGRTFTYKNLRDSAPIIIIIIIIIIYYYDDDDDDDEDDNVRNDYDGS